MFCSIIIPLYNKEDYISTAIHSILMQTHQNFEVIVIDDGSTDNSVRRLRSFNDQRIKLYQQPNSGVSCARNRGIDLVQGDLIFFLDADDWYLPNFLDTIVSMALQYPRIVYFATNYKSINNPNETVITWESGDTQSVKLINDLFKAWRAHPFFSTGSVAVRRPNLLQLQPCFPIGEQHGEDQDLWFKLAEQYPLAFCTAKLTAYRQEVSGSLNTIFEASDKLIPVFHRLEQRALTQKMPKHLRSSALKLVAKEKVTIARHMLANNRRFGAFMLLINTRYGITSKRWWVSLAMCLIFTPNMAQRWENWRLTRIKTW